MSEQWRWSREDSKNPYNIRNIIYNLVRKFSDVRLWNRAVQQLRNEGKLFDDVRDIKSIKILVRDMILEERGDVIANTLYSQLSKTIANKCTIGIADWYRVDILNESILDTEQTPHRVRLYEYQNGECVACGYWFTFDELTVDHIIPISAELRQIGRAHV